MEEFRGTPGPWSTSKHYEDCLIVIDSRGYEIVSADTLPILSNYAEKLGIQHWADDERAAIELSQDEQAANAYLIAAAPEMLQALQLMVSAQVLPVYHQTIANAAITKALGK